MLRSKRTHKEIRTDSWDHYSGLAENNPDQRAVERFRRPPAYQSGKLIETQGKQMESKPLLEYLSERYNIKEVVISDGQENT